MCKYILNDSNSMVSWIGRWPLLLYSVVVVRKLKSTRVTVTIEGSHFLPPCCKVRSSTGDKAFRRTDNAMLALITEQLKHARIRFGAYKKPKPRIRICSDEKNWICSLPWSWCFCCSLNGNWAHTPFRLQFKRKTERQNVASGETNS